MCSQYSADFGYEESCARMSLRDCSGLSGSKSSTTNEILRKARSGLLQGRAVEEVPHRILIKIGVEIREVLGLAGRLHVESM